MKAFEKFESHLADELGLEQAKEFIQELEGNPELRDAYFEQLKIDIALRVLYTGQVQVDAVDFNNAVLARLKLEESTSSDDFSRSILTEIVESQQQSKRWPDFAKSVVIALLIGVIMAFGLRQFVYTTSVAGSVGYGEVLGSGEVLWAHVMPATEQALSWSADSRKIIDDNDGWVANEELTLEQGVAEINFNSGARAWLKAPATIIIKSDKRAYLKTGQITAEVTEASSGFTVFTPTAKVVDIGTHFGVIVGTLGETEVHVLKGEVELSLVELNAATRRLTEGKALRTARSEKRLVPTAFEKEVFTNYEFIQPAPEVYYNFDGVHPFSDSGIAASGGPPAARLVPEVKGTIKRQKNGVVGRSLVLSDGDLLFGDFAEKIEPEEPFTISFWMKTNNNSEAIWQSIVSLNGASPEAHWKVGFHRYNGTHRLFASFGRDEESKIVGETDLVDGDWHHVAVRFLGGKDVSIDSHVHIYVDGKQEFISYTQSKKLISKAPTMTKLRVGARKSGFVGSLDEVKVFNKSISTHAIQQMSVIE